MGGCRKVRGDDCTAEGGEEPISRATERRPQGAQAAVRRVAERTQQTSSFDV